MELASFSNLFGSNIGKKIRLVREIPLLMSATCDSEEATPGYVIEQVIALSFDVYKNVNDELVDWLNGRLRQNSLCVKLKVIKIFSQLVVKGSSKFKEVLRKHSNEITTTARLAGLARNVQMAEMYSSIRQFSKDILKELYRNDDSDDDDADDDDGGTNARTYKSDKSKFQGFGSNWNKQGFGNTVPESGSVISNLADRLVELTSPQHNNPIKEDMPSSFGLTTSPTPEIANTDLFFLNNEVIGREGVEKVLIREYLDSTDVMINKRTRKIINDCGLVDKRKFIYCLRDHLNDQDAKSIIQCLCLLEALLRSDLYSIQDIDYLFNDPLNHLYANHLDQKISCKARKILLTMKALLS